MQAEQLSFFDELDFSNAATCPFLGRKVAITGTFPLGRQALRSAILKLGASEVRYDKLQRTTHILLVGDSPNQEVLNYWRLYVHDGYNILRLKADDFRRISDGEYSAYQAPKEITKDLHITREHLYWKAPEIESLKNLRKISPIALDRSDILYSKEIFMHTSIMEEYPKLAQALGCLGAYANTEMAEDTDCILIPESMPDIVCQRVEEYYNASRATQFNTPFIILEDLLSFLEKRCTDFPDDVLHSLCQKEN